MVPATVRSLMVASEMQWKGATPCSLGLVPVAVLLRLAVSVWPSPRKVPLKGRLPYSFCSRSPTVVVAVTSPPSFTTLPLKSLP